MALSALNESNADGEKIIQEHEMIDSGDQIMQDVVEDEQIILYEGTDIAAVQRNSSSNHDDDDDTMEYDDDDDIMEYEK